MESRLSFPTKHLGYEVKGRKDLGDMGKSHITDAIFIIHVELVPLSFPALWGKRPHGTMSQPGKQHLSGLAYKG